MNVAHSAGKKYSSDARKLPDMRLRGSRSDFTVLHVASASARAAAALLGAKGHARELLQNGDAARRLLRAVLISGCILLFQKLPR
jgi:hypothetical protein